MIRGSGPYAYLQKSVRDGKRVHSAHLAYLGAYGEDNLIPSKMFTLPPEIKVKVGVEQSQLLVPALPPSMEGKQSANGDTTNDN